MWCWMLLPLGTIAQTYFEIPTATGYWFKQRITPNGQCTTDVFHIEGDTVIRGKKYGSLYVDRSGWNDRFDSTEAEFLAFVRNDGARRIQITFANDFADRLHFDFNLLAGDSAVIYPFSTVPFKVKVDILDTIVVAGEERRRWQLSGDYPSVWVEGIGCLSGWFAPPLPGNPANAYVQCLYQSDTLIYSRNNQACFCNGSVSVEPLAEWRIFQINDRMLQLSLGYLPEEFQVSFTDLNGRMVQVAPSSDSSYDLRSLASGLYVMQLDVPGLGKVRHKVFLP